MFFNYPVMSDSDAVYSNNDAIANCTHPCSTEDPIPSKNWLCNPGGVLESLVLMINCVPKYTVDVNTSAVQKPTPAALNLTGEAAPIPAPMPEPVPFETQSWVLPVIVASSAGALAIGTAAAVAVCHMHKKEAAQTLTTNTNIPAVVAVATTMQAAEVGGAEISVASVAQAANDAVTAPSCVNSMRGGFVAGAIGRTAELVATPFVGEKHAMHCGSVARAAYHVASGNAVGAAAGYAAGYAAQRAGIPAQYVAPLQVGISVALGGVAAAADLAAGTVGSVAGREAVNTALSVGRWCAQQASVATAAVAGAGKNL
jgi:hypothetical protein